MFLIFSSSSFAICQVFIWMLSCGWLAKCLGNCSHSLESKEYILVMNDEVEEEKHDHPSNYNFTTSPSASSPDSQVEVENEEPNEPKLQHTWRPTWMQDCKIIRVNQIDDLVSHFNLFSGLDPIVFHDATKESKWQKTMDKEIEAIKKKNLGINKSSKEPKTYWSKMGV